ncbi:LytR C-terminal domain-containing protein [Pseudoduganella umbonata]|nr:LytR C-terminal domain-containing protein [Pseudoduganella umbonata]MBB3223772.1 Flp pilus assembly protein TadD [Pseudoduganella umbonata]
MMTIRDWTLRAGRMAAAACIGALLMACGGRQPSLTQHTVPVPAIGADGYYAIGRAEHAARRFDAAQRAWDAALRLDPRHADTRNGMAVLAAEQGNYGKAIALWRKLVEEATGLPPAEQAFLLGNLGYALYLHGGRDEAVTLLERACVLDPHQPRAWEHLASVLEAQGHADRALQMMSQARTLRTHDIRHDYALTGTRAPQAAMSAAAVPAALGPSPWPDGLARTELRKTGAVIEVHRVTAAAAQPLPAKDERDGADELYGKGGDGAVRLEISNGNGARGMAAAWKRRLAGPEWKSVRLTNEKPYAVPVTRIEYRGDANAFAVARALARRLGLPAPQQLANGAARTDLRIVLGWDQRTLAAPAAKASALVAMQAGDGGR